MLRSQLAYESALFNHPLFIHLMIITDTNGVIIIIHKRLKKQQRVNAHRSHFIIPAGFAHH